MTDDLRLLPSRDVSGSRGSDGGSSLVGGSSSSGGSFFGADLTKAEAVHDEDFLGGRPCDFGVAERFRFPD